MVFFKICRSYRSKIHRCCCFYKAVVLASGHYSANGAVAQGSQPKGDSNNTTIFVVGLDSDISDEDLRQHYCESDSDNTTIFVLGLDSAICDEDLRQHYCEFDSNNTTIFVVGLDSDISDEDLRQHYCESDSDNTTVSLIQTTLL
ncbi:uncharacterized protein [Phaseolus vulgaris]|uniref:uncharacterized protein isoform X2 n=1 Tax=Phaseolus vulgaris TaxID=3885 RepID=UPI0035CAA74B